MKRRAATAREKEPWNRVAKREDEERRKEEEGGEGNKGQSEGGERLG